MTDNDIAQEIIAGNTYLRNVLVKRHQNKVYAYINSIVYNKEDAQDLTQETFVKVFQNIHMFSQSYKLTTWIYTIARNHAIDFRRSAKTPTISVEDARINLDVYMTESPEHTLIRDERNKNLWETITKLRDVYQTIIELRYYKGYTYKEIAQEMNIPEGTAKAYVHQAHKAIRKLWFQRNNLIQPKK